MADEINDPPANMDPRVGLAAERTLLAWVRTGLALMGLGFIVAKFGIFLTEVAAIQQVPTRPSTGMSLWIGGTLVVLGVLINVLATVQHIGLLRRLERGEPYQPRIWSMSVVLTLLLSVMGIVMTAYLVSSSS